MASVQRIRSRINGITKTKQITHSMRLVSYSKVQKSKAALNVCQPYYHYTAHIMDILSCTYTGRRHPYFTQVQPKRAGIIALSTDRGLCGAYNMNIARRTAALVRQMHANVFLITVGNKIKPLLKREKIHIDSNYIGISETPIYEEAEMLSFQLIELLGNKEIDEIYIVYTSFVSMLEQHVAVKRLIPHFPPPDFASNVHWAVEPKEEALIAETIPEYICAALYQAMLDSALSEQAARVSSMDAASRNSDELAEHLTLQYNKLRQAGITNQIIEIVSGATAQHKE